MGEFLRKVRKVAGQSLVGCLAESQWNRRPQGARKAGFVTEGAYGGSRTGGADQPGTGA